MINITIIGAGAAGFFAGINIAEKTQNTSIEIFEANNDVLNKVRISGGGRCNLTHACFEPNELVKYYPRGEKELLGPFHRFMTGDTMQWFEENGVPTKIEGDNRVFPAANTSQAIIDCFKKKAKENHINIHVKTKITDFYPNGNKWIIETKNEKKESDYLIITTGSSSFSWKILEKLNHNIITPVPSLFTFKNKDEKIQGLAGISLKNTKVKVVNAPLEQTGPLLITHQGFSGPAILKISAYGARILNEKQYDFEIQINWINKSKEKIESIISNWVKNSGRKLIKNSKPFNIPNRLWLSLIKYAGVSDQTNWGELNKLTKEKLILEIHESSFKISGKNTFKEEFVTAGGVDLKEINFKDFESKLHPNLFLAGEVLNIDAITGGFNFQNAWTGAYIISEAISKRILQLN